jgi:hypothetical protein
MNDTIDLTSIHGQGQDLVRLAVDLGWTGRNEKGGQVVLRAPEPHQSVTVLVPTTKSWNQRKTRTMRQKIIRYGDPVLRATLLAAADTAAKGNLTDSQTYNAFLDHEMGKTPPPTATVKGDHTTRVSPAKPTVLSILPWVAKRGTKGDIGRGYESEATLERKWSDGTVDYVCSWPGCDYTSHTPIAVSRHYGASRSHDKPAAQEQVFKIEPWTVEPRSRIGRLAQEINLALVHCREDMGREELAHCIAKAIIENRDANKQTRTDHEGEPLTPEQLLERIRVMVDDGSYGRRLAAEAEQVEKIAALSQELEACTRNLSSVLAAESEMREEIARVEQERDQAVRDQAKAEERWSALKSLIEGES